MMHEWFEFLGIVQYWNLAGICQMMTFAPAAAQHPAAEDMLATTTNYTQYMYISQVLVLEPYSSTEVVQCTLI